MKKIKVNLARYFFTVCLFVSVLLFSTCSKDDFDFDSSSLSGWQPVMAFPITSASLDIRNIISPDSIEELIQDNENFLTLVYKSKNKSIDCSSLITLPDQQFEKSAQFDISSEFRKGDSVLIPLTLNAMFNLPENAIVNSVWLKNGNLNLHLSTDINYKGKILIKIPAAIKNGQFFSKTLVYSGSDIDFNIDLAGYTLRMININNKNLLDVFFNFILYHNGNPNKSPYSLNAGMSFNAMKFSKITGFFGTKTFTFSDSFDIGLYRNSLHGNILFEDPKFKVNTTSSIGIPIQANFEHVMFQSPDNSPANIELTGFPNPVNIPVPPENSVLSYALNMDKNNSNLTEILNILPRSLTYEVHFVTNPRGKTVQNVIYDNSSFNAGAELELPFYGKVWNFTLQDTFPFEFDRPSMIDSIRFKTITTNGFPFDGRLQVYFLDAGNKKVDSLVSDNSNILSSGIVDAFSGKVLGPTTNIYYYGKSKAQMTKMEACQKMIVLSRLSTTDNGSVPVKVYSDYILKIKLSAEACLKTD